MAYPWPESLVSEAITTKSSPAMATTEPRLSRSCTRRDRLWGSSQFREISLWASSLLKITK